MGEIEKTFPFSYPSRLEEHKEAGSVLGLQECRCLSLPFLLTL